jgi:hypothetical protein
MAAQTYWETIKIEGQAVVDKLKELVHEGNVRRVIVQHQGRTIAEFPLTAGVVGVVLAPIAAAIATLVALLKDCTIQVEREQAASTEDERTRAAR